MNYAKLDIEERMRMAKEYALLIGSDMKTPLKMIVEISTVFYLSTDQATEAYIESQHLYSEEWRKTWKQKYTKLIFGFFASMIISAFLLFIGQEKYFVTHWAMGILFILLTLGVLWMLIATYSQEKKLKYRYRSHQ